MTHSYYNNAENLTGTMLEFGKYTLKYKPPQGCTESKVKMEITSEATLPQMLEFFTDFLKASGYCIDDDRELVFERKAPDFSQDFWAEDGISFTGNPYASPDTISFGAAQFAGMWGGLKDDTITLG
jgi:hypothetical protein